MKRLGWLFLASALAALSSIYLAGCLACTDMGCMNYVALDLPKEGLEQGLWVFELEAEGEHWTCEISVPVTEGDRPHCDRFEASFERAWVNDQWSPEPVLIRLYGAPATVSVTATHDGEIVLERQLKPKYRKDVVDNGGGSCDDVCDVAQMPLWPAEG